MQLQVRNIDVFNPVNDWTYLVCKLGQALVKEFCACHAT
jgi:hypothetical protein